MIGNCEQLCMKFHGRMCSVKHLSAEFRNPIKTFCILLSTTVVYSVEKCGNEVNAFMLLIGHKNIEIICHGVGYDGY